MTWYLWNFIVWAKTPFDALDWWETQYCAYQQCGHVETQAPVTQW